MPLPYNGIFSHPGRQDRHFSVDSITVKARNKSSTEMTIRGLLGGHRYTCRHLLMEGQACQGSVMVHGHYLMKELEEEFLIAILQVIDENRDETMETEMARLSGAMP